MVFKCMQRFSTEACHLERARGLEDLKRGIRGLPRNSSPLVSLVDKEFMNLKSGFQKQNFTIFANFKIPFTRKSWLLKFGFANRLAQILEPKLLVHEILKFTGILIIHAVRCTVACTSNVRGGFIRVLPRNCKQTRDLKRG